MENRSVARGSGLVILLATLAALGGLSLILLPRLSALQRQTEDFLIRCKLENAARDALMRATQWVQLHRPAGPSGSFEIFHIGGDDGPQRLELSLPSKVASRLSEGIEVTTRLQWCLFTVENIPLGKARDFPPSLVLSPDEAAFRQSFDSVNAHAVQDMGGETGAWRLVVTAHLKDDARTVPSRQVCFERVMVLER